MDILNITSMLRKFSEASSRSVKPALPPMHSTITDQCESQFQMCHQQEGVPAWCALEVSDSRALTDDRWVVGSVFHEILQHVPEHERPRFVLLNVRHAAGPVTWSKRTGDAVVIRLAVEPGGHWAMTAFQLGHEIVHALAFPAVADNKHWHHEHAWFEEALASAASYYVLVRMVETWSKSDTLPFPVAKQYAGSMLHYFQQNAMEAIQAVGHYQSFAQWCEIHESTLRGSSEHEHLTLEKQASLFLLPVMMNNPKLWRALRYLDPRDGSPHPTGQSLRDYLTAWHDRTPEELRGPIVEILMMLQQEM